MLNLERLRVLHAIATYGSVRAASEVLAVTTSAVSQQIGKLEGELGQRLVERNGRGVRLTDAALLLVKHADRIMSLVAEAEADVEAHRGAVVGQLSLAAIPTAARGLAPAALRMLAQWHPQLVVELVEMEPEAALPMVSRGDLDVAIAPDWINAPLAVPDGLVKSALHDDLADIALAIDHPLARRKVIDLHELAHESWISCRRGSICHEWLLLTLRAQGVEPRLAHTAEEFQTQLALVAAGLGVGVVPRLGRDPVPAGVRIVPVRPTLSRRIHAIWRADAARRPAIRAIVKALRAAVPGGGGKAK
ncbi:MAG: transcriptional regulator, LysR family [Myxococcales bacterium]|nr:transcriptional regulator, LysR family [Myxococcales bacterium]